MEITIGSDGSVHDAEILVSVPLLDQAALDAVRQWKFEPPHFNGVDIPLIVPAAVNFSLR
jgi:protein TonB